MGSDHQRWNLTVFTVGESVWGFQMALISSATVLVLLLRHYGAGERMIGAIAAVEMAALIFPQVLGMYLFRSLRQRKRRLVRWHVLVMLPFLFAIGTTVLWGEAWLPRTLMPWVLMFFFGCYTATIGVIIAVWWDWIANIFPQAIRGMAIGLSFAASAGCGTLGGLLAGWLIKSATGTATYGYLYLAAGACGIVAMLCFLAIREPAFPAHDPPPPSPADLLRLFRHSLADRNFRDFLVGRILATAGFAVMPFVALHYAAPAGGGLEPGIIVACAAAATAMTAVCNLGLGRLGDRYGHRWGILIGTGGQLTALLVMLWGGGLTACILTYAATGVAIAAAIISHSNMMFETCPHHDRTAHLTLGSLVMSGSTVFCPLLAGVIAEQWGLRSLFALSAAITVLALAWLALRVRDPRTISLAQARTLCSHEEAAVVPE